MDIHYFLFFQGTFLIQFKALAQNEFNHLTFNCTGVTSTACYPTGQSVISAFALENPGLWYCVIINVGLATAFLGFGFLFFNTTTRPLLRLK